MSSFESPQNQNQLNADHQYIKPRDFDIQKESNLLPYTYEIPDSELVTADTAKNFKWFSSNSSVEQKETPDGKSIYGLSLTTNPEYAQSYSKDLTVNVFDLSQARLKSVTFNEGMTIDSEKLMQFLGEGYDGVIFEGMGGPEVALLKNVALLEGQTLPVPRGYTMLIEQRRPISTVIEKYQVALPDGYVKEGERYIFRDQTS